MKQYAQYIILILALLSGCYKDIELYQDNDVPQKPVIFSYLNTDSTIKVFVTRTAYPGQLDTSVWLDDAQVSIYENGQLVDNNPVYKTGVLQPYDPYASAYVSNIKPAPGQEYKIEVQALGQTASASVKIPQPVNITDFSLISATVDTQEAYYNMATLSGSFKISFTDPADEENYYLLTVFTKIPQTIAVSDTQIIHVWQNISLIGNTTQNASTGIISPVPPDYIAGMGYVFSDLRYNGQEVSFLINVWGNVYVPGDTAKIYAALISIDKSLYEFYVNNHENQQSRMSPFSEASNIYTNVEGGYGLVGAMSISKDSLMISVK